MSPYKAMQCNTVCPSVENKGPLGIIYLGEDQRWPFLIDYISRTIPATTSAYSVVMSEERRPVTVDHGSCVGCS